MAGEACQACLLRLFGRWASSTFDIYGMPSAFTSP